MEISTKINMSRNNSKFGVIRSRKKSIADINKNFSNYVQTNIFENVFHTFIFEYNECLIVRNILKK